MREPEMSKATSSVDVVRASIDAWNRRDMAASHAATAPDAVLKPAEFWADSQIRHGRDAMMELLTDMKSAFESDSFVVEEYTEADDTVVARGYWCGVPKGGGSELRLTVSAVFKLSDGKVIELA
jgi:ketosteroid isomerase-like protein